MGDRELSLSLSLFHTHTHSPSLSLLLNLCVLGGGQGAGSGVTAADDVDEIIKTIRFSYLSEAGSVPKMFSDRVARLNHFPTIKL